MAKKKKTKISLAGKAQKIVADNSLSITGDNHSDFWRSHYHQKEMSEGEDKDSFMLSTCLEEVSRIANAFDGNFSLSYYDQENPGNKIDDDTVKINPDIAISSQNMGEKVDIFSGEILLGVALREQAKHCNNLETNYSLHIKNISDSNLRPIDRAASMMYMAIEVYSAGLFIDRETPGFSKYAESRSEFYINNIDYSELENRFAIEPSGPDKFSAILREFDSLNCRPLNYQGFNQELNSIINQVSKIEDPSVRLSAAKQITVKYLSHFMGDDTDMGAQESFINQAQEGLTSSNLYSEAESEYIDSMSEADKMGYSEFVKEKSEDISSVGAEVDIKFADKKVKVKVRDDVEEFSALSTNYMQKLYYLDKNEVADISASIEDSLLILNVESPKWNEFSFRSGEIDEGALHKVCSDDDGVFYQTQVIPESNIQVIILLDESGSMYAHTAGIDRSRTKMNSDKEVYLRRSDVARKLATAFAEGTKNISGVSLSVYGHAGPEPICNVYKYIDGDSTEDDYYRIAGISAKLHNYDGYAIAKAAELSILDHRNFDKRIMFILSDGEPSISSYTGDEARTHISNVVKGVNAAGIDTFVIGIDNAFSIEEGNAIYGEGNCISLNDFDLSEVSAIISAFLEKISMEII